MSENNKNTSSIDRIISKTKYNRSEHKKFYLFHLFHRTQTLYFMFALIIFLLVLTIVNVSKQQNVIFSCIMFGVTCAMVPILIISKINQVVKQETPERVKSTDTIEVTKSKSLGPITTFDCKVLVDGDIYSKGTLAFTKVGKETIYNR